MAAHRGSGIAQGRDEKWRQEDFQGRWWSLRQSEDILRATVNQEVLVSEVWGVLADESADMTTVCIYVDMLRGSLRTYLHINMFTVWHIYIFSALKIM